MFKEFYEQIQEKLTALRENDIKMNLYSQIALKMAQFGRTQDALEIVQHDLTTFSDEQKEIIYCKVARILGSQDQIEQSLQIIDKHLNSYSTLLRAYKPMSNDYHNDSRFKSSVEKKFKPFKNNTEATRYKNKLLNPNGRNI